MPKKKAEPRPVKREYSVEELTALPTLSEGHFENCKIETPDYRVRLMRVTETDGYKGSPVVYESLDNGVWLRCDAAGHVIPDEITSITVVGRRWWRKNAGNTLHSVTILVNGVEVGAERGNGGERVYLQTARDWLWRNGYVEPEKGDWLWRTAEREGFRLYDGVTDVPREKDL